MAEADVTEAKDYKFFRSFSAKVESRWPVRKAEQFWRRLREKRIAGEISLSQVMVNIWGRDTCGSRVFQISKKRY